MIITITITITREGIYKGDLWIDSLSTSFFTHLHSHGRRFSVAFFCNGLRQMNRTERLKIVSGINVDLQVRRSKLIKIKPYLRENLIKLLFGLIQLIGSTQHKLNV